MVRDRWLTLRAETWRTASGVVLDPWWMLDGADWAHAVAFTPDDRVVLVRQFRPGAGAPTLELPGGLVDATDPDPLAAARRELREETGYAAPNWRPLPPLWHDPAHATHRIHFAVATGAAPVGVQHLDQAEDVAVVLMTVAEALAAPDFRMAGQVAGLLLAVRAR